MKKINLIGSQNAGKSTLFNKLSTLQVQTANYAGATVQFHKSTVKKKLNLDAEIVDTPGLTSLNGQTPEQVSTVDSLFSKEIADLYIAVIDATQIQRQLLLVEQLRDAGFPLLVCLTNKDRLEKSGQSIDIKSLEQRINAPCIMLNSHDKSSAQYLCAAIDKRLLQVKDSKVELDRSKVCERSAEEHYKDIDLFLQKEQQTTVAAKTKKSIDKILLHPFLGIGAFFFIMFALFTSIYSFASWPMEQVEAFFEFAKELTTKNMSEGLLVDFINSGILDGICSVAMFLPQIIILFFLLGILEDSGYLARASMLIDKPLSLIGLNGRSFVPLLSGFACAIPAMMAARTIRSPLERLATLFIIPIMTCSARLPVYVLLVTFITPSEKPWVGGLIMTALYFTSILLGIILATAISIVFRKKEKAPSFFQLEIPEIKQPLLSVVVKSTYQRSVHYIKKAGPIIIVISICLWTLTTFPRQNGQAVDVQDSYAASVGKFIEPAVKPMGLDWRGGVSMITAFAAREVFVQSLTLMYRTETAEAPKDIKLVSTSDLQPQEIIETKTEPAEEIDEEEQEQRALLETMQHVTFEGSDQKIFTLASCIGIMFFFTIALQCFPTVAVAKQESASWKFASIQLFSLTGIAYIGAIIIVQGLRALGIS